MSKHGFTLVEVLIVISVVLTLLGLGLFMSFDSYRGFIFRSERVMLVSILEKARSRAINNYFQTSWGVCFDPNTESYISFRGDHCELGLATNEVIPKSSSVELAGYLLHSPIVFKQLTGNLLYQMSPADAEATSTLSNGLSTTTISINNEGRINW